MGRASALVFAREGALVVGCDLSVGAAQATVELMRGTGGEMVSKQLRHLTEPANCQALVDPPRWRTRSAPPTLSSSPCGST